MPVPSITRVVADGLRRAARRSAALRDEVEVDLGNSRSGVNGADTMHPMRLQRHPDATGDARDYTGEVWVLN